MATVSKLAAVLSGLVQNVDLTASDLVTNSVWVGGTSSSPSVQVTPTLLNSYLINPMTTAGDIIYENSTPAPARLPIGSTGNVLTVVGGLPSWQPPATSGGTVTSVGLADTSTTPIYTVSNTPVTTSGTIDITLTTQSANTVFAGPTTGSAAEPTFRSLVAADIPSLSATYVTQSEVGAANGVASLDSGGKVPAAQLPSTLMNYRGAWDASTNTPTLADGTGTNGDVYRASVAGTQNLGSGSQTWAVGDFAIYNGSIWQHSPAADGVSSVNGSTGAVTVNAINQLTGDVTAGPASGSQSATATIAAGAVTASKLGTVTDGVTLDQSGSGSTLEIKSGGVGTTQLAATSVTAAKLGSDVAGAGLSGGNGSALAVAYAPAMEMSFTAGFTLAANTSYLVRLAVNGETAGQVYQADPTSASTNLKFWAIGMASGGGSGVSSGSPVTVTMFGSWTLGSSDTAFGSTDIGKPVWLSSSTGGFSVTAPSASGTAAYKVGVVQTTSSLLLDSKQLTGIN